MSLSVIDAVTQAAPNAQIVRLPEVEFEDALDLARMELEELSLSAPEEPSDAEVDAPQAGDVLVYKKHYPTGSGDKFRRWKQCNHSRGWAQVRKADQAMLGIQKLEGVRPRSLERCMTCTGPGLYRATF